MAVNKIVADAAAARAASGASTKNTALAPTPVVTPPPKLASTITSGLSNTPAAQPTSAAPKPPPPVSNVPNTVVGTPPKQYVQGTGTEVPGQQGSGFNESYKPPAPTPAAPTPAPAPTPATSTTPAPTSTPASTTTGDFIQDEGTGILKDRTDQFVKDLGGIKDMYTQQKAEDLSSIQREYEARKATLGDSQTMLEELNRQRMATIEASTAAQRQEAEAAYKKQQAVVDLQKEQTDAAYKDMVNAQQLANKRAQVRKETALGVLGGNFSTAGVAQIEDVIMQGEFAVTTIQKNAELAQRDLSDKAVALIDDYKTSNLKIEAWKQENINNAFKDLSTGILEIKNNQLMAETEKEQAIRDIGGKYNDKVAALTGQAIQAKYDLAGEIVTRSDTLMAQMKDDANKLRDDARTALKDLVTTFSPESFTELTPVQKTQLRDLEQKAGYPQGFVEQGLETYKSEGNDIKNRLNEIRASGNVVVRQAVDASGNLTVIYSNKTTGQSTTESLGKLSKPMLTLGIMPNPDGSGTFVKFDRLTGTVGDAPVVGGGPTGGDSGTPQDALQVPDKSKGGQCGHFVNQYSGLRMLDSYQSKLDAIAPYKVTDPQPGDVFVSPYKGTGHAGFIMRNNGDGTVEVKDSNYGLDELVRTHTMSIKDMSFGRVGGGATTQPNIAPEKTEQPLKTGNAIIDTVSAVWGKLFPTEDLGKKNFNTVDQYIANVGDTISAEDKKLFQRLYKAGDWKALNKRFNDLVNENKTASQQKAAQAQRTENLANKVTGARRSFGGATTP